MHINEMVTSVQSSNVISYKLLKNSDNRSVKTAENVLTYGGQCPHRCSLPGFSLFLMEGSNHIPNMQTIHFL